MNQKELDVVIGQEDLLKRVSSIFNIFVSTGSVIKPHFIVTGESGTGKTFVINQLCKAFELPMITINASQITKEGISGNSLSKVLKPINNYKGRQVVCFIDEFDKLFITGNGDQATQPEISSVQNELLKIVEEKTTEVYDDYGKYMTIDISNVLFVFAGAFNGDKVDLSYLLKCGVKTEFLGRVSLVFRTDPIDLDLILDNMIKNKLLINYCRLFTNYNIVEVVEELKPFIADNFYNNRFGLRFINSTIHKYFIYGGISNIQEEEQKDSEKAQTFNTFRTKFNFE